MQPELLAAVCQLVAGAALVLGAPPTKEATNKDREFELDCLAAHNKWRRLHGAPDLVLERKITAFAQKRADFIAASDGVEFRHPKDLAYGENLAWHSRADRTCAELVKMWYDEVDLYDFKKKQFSVETGHFTQLVWKSTERLGCARAVSTGKRGGVYLVCNYDPPGNWAGEEDENISPRSDVTPAAGASVPRAGAPTAAAELPPKSPTTTSTTTTTTTAKPVVPVSGGDATLAKKPPATTVKPNNTKKTKKKKAKGKGKKKVAEKEGDNKDKKNNTVGKKKEEEEELAKKNATTDDNKRKRAGHNNSNSNSNSNNKRKKKKANKKGPLDNQKPTATSAPARPTTSTMAPAAG